MTNPYDAVNIDSFVISEHSRSDDNVVFRVHLADHKAFDGCVFRDYLFRALFDHTKDEFLLGNDGTVADFGVKDLAMQVSVRDAAKLKSIGWLDNR